MKFIEIVSIEDTFFKLIEKPAKVKLSHQLVKINYSHLSPFKGGDILYYQKDRHVYLWYSKNPLKEKKRIYIPEGYFIYKLYKDKEEAIVIYQRRGLISFFVIINRELFSMVTLKDDINIDDTVQLLKKEHSLKSAELISIDKAYRYRANIKDLIIFSNIELVPLSVLQSALEMSKLPIIVLFIILSSFDMFNLYFLKDQKEGKEQYLHQLKKENADIKELMRTFDGKRKFWSKFIESEVSYPSFYQILDIITRQIDKNEGYISLLEFSENRLNMWIGIKNSSSKAINDLVSTNYFDEVKVISSSKDQNKPEYEIVQLELLLSKLNSHSHDR